VIRARQPRIYIWTLTGLTKSSSEGCTSRLTLADFFAPFCRSRSSLLPRPGASLRDCRPSCEKLAGWKASGSHQRLGRPAAQRSDLGSHDRAGGFSAFSAFSVSSFVVFVFSPVSCLSRVSCLLWLL